MGGAGPLYEPSLVIPEKALGFDHPAEATALNRRTWLLSICSSAVNLFSLNTCFSLMLQGKYTEVEPLYEGCQAIEKKVLGPDHPSVAPTLNNRAELLARQVRTLQVSWKKFPFSGVVQIL